MHFLAGFVNGGEGSARQFKLAAWFERDVSKALGVRERNDVPFFHHGCPAEALLQSFKQRPDGAYPLVRHRPERIGQKREFFMLGSHAPFRLGFGARADCFDELCPVFDGRLGGFGFWSRAAHE